MTRANAAAKWMEHEREAMLYALRRGDFVEQDAVNALRRLQKEIPELIEMGLENNRKSKLYKEVT